MGKPIINEEKLEKIAEMRERGVSCAAIGKTIGMSRGAVNWHCLKEGIEPPNPQDLKAHNPGPAVVKRGNHVVRRFTEEEDQRLLAMEAQGLKRCEMARALGRKGNSITGRLMTLARRDERAEA